MSSSDPDDLLPRLADARYRLERSFGRPPTLTELAVHVRLSEDIVSQVLRAAAEPLPDVGDGDLGHA